MIAIGVGCRKGCGHEAIVALVRRVLADVEREGEEAIIFTHADKQGEAGLVKAARDLGLPLIFLDHAALSQSSARAATHSPRVARLFGLPSIAETAALAGAGPASTLIAPRVSSAGASCAVARSREDAKASGDCPK